jgi:hypothetical protein
LHDVFADWTGSRVILISIGMPSQLAEWCDALLLGLANRCLEPVEAVALNSLDELAVAVLGARAGHLVVCSRQPAIRLQAALVDSGRPFVVALGDPRAALRDLAQRPGYDLVTATRAVASSCAAIHSLTKAPQALVLSGAPGFDPAAAATAIARHFGLPVALEAIAAVIDELGTVGRMRDDQEDSGWWQGLGERDQAIADGALQPFGADWTASTGPEPFIWEPELFFVDDGSPVQAPASNARLVDITGRPRFVIYGPYITLPPGAWSARIVLGFSAETAGMSFLVEVFAGRQLAHTRISPTTEQIIETDLSFVIDQLADQPVQIRIVNERAAFDGRLALGYVTIAPQPEVRPEARDRLVAALRE